MLLSQASEAALEIRVSAAALATALLSPREAQVVSLMAIGCSNFNISARLRVSEETVKTHVRHILRKMDARTRAHVVALVLTSVPRCSDGTVELADVA